ncbi:MAG: DNA-3-methyladenine glycosylase I [Hyphomicrobiaceae bacterium]|nr:DNA-3-methyladenine glycosylase I [Hyphomicrobiaceae bacterium]
MNTAAAPADDERRRCPWAGIGDTEYARYHDEEWGVPLLAERDLFEKLVLEGFQAGLSWLTILRKRPAFRAAFANFDIPTVAQFGEPDIDRLMTDHGIVRHRGKIEAAISNARACLALRETGGLPALIWSHFPDGPLRHRRTSTSEIPSATTHSKAVSKALKARGFRFVGPTTVYACLQSAGMVNDHLVTCHRHGPCDQLQEDVRARLV